MKVLTFGEIMLRLKAPGQERFFQSPMLEATFGGGEANVAVSLANYGMETEYLTVLPENDIAEACVRELRYFGVDTKKILRGAGRMGIYYLEGGHQRNVLAVIFPGEEGGFEVGDAVDQDVSDEEQQHSGGQGSSQPHQAAQQGGLHAGGGTVAAPVGVDGFGGGTAHVRHSSAVVGNGIRHGPCLLSKR